MIDEMKKICGHNARRDGDGIVCFHPLNTQFTECDGKDRISHFIECSHTVCPFLNFFDLIKNTDSAYKILNKLKTEKAKDYLLVE